jgi:hypothetical protein
MGATRNDNEVHSPQKLIQVGAMSKPVNAMTHLQLIRALPERRLVVRISIIRSTHDRDLNVWNPSYQFRQDIEQHRVALDGMKAAHESEDQRVGPDAHDLGKSPAGRRSIYRRQPHTRVDDPNPWGFIAKHFGYRLTNPHN